MRVATIPEMTPFLTMMPPPFLVLTRHLNGDQDNRSVPFLALIFPSGAVPVPFAVWPRSCFSAFHPMRTKTDSQMAS